MKLNRLVSTVFMGFCIQAGPLHDAAPFGSSDEIQRLLDNGADFNEIDDHGNSALHIAAIWDNVECADLLINRGARLDAQNSRWESPLHLAAHHKRLRCRASSDIHNGRAALYNGA